MKKQLQNFTLKEFLKKDVDLVSYYTTVLSYVKPTKTKKSIINLRLKDVENIRGRFDSMQLNDVVKVLSIVQGVKKEEVYDFRILDVFSLLASVKQQMNVIHKAEVNLSESGDSDIRYDMVGGSERMSVFGVYNLLDRLSGNDVLKYKRILKMRYSEVFTVLKMRSVKNSIQREMSKIKLTED